MNEVKEVLGRQVRSLRNLSHNTRFTPEVTDIFEESANTIEVLKETLIKITAIITHREE